MVHGERLLMFMVPRSKELSVNHEKKSFFPTEVGDTKLDTLHSLAFIASSGTSGFAHTF